MNTVAPSVSGTTTVGQQLTAAAGSWTGSPTPTYSYAWQRCNSSGANCLPISGATSQTYTLVSGDAGSTIAVTVTASNSAGSSRADSTAVGPVTNPATAPVNTVAPSVSGTTTVGQQLTAAAGSWTGSPTPTYSYAWQRCNSSGANCLPISGATSQTYTLVSGDAGSTIAVTVTASNSAGSSSADSTAVGPVTNPATAPVNTVAPSVSGTTTVGQQLTAAARAPGPARRPRPTATAWQRCDSGGANCLPIGGATSQTYTLVSG